ncbi:MAG: hypothetical protein FWH26_00425 [Oscillospiraceae bacterium]|nr:hypothetical protein [Oscillospiraceae bacterium]
MESLFDIISCAVQLVALAVLVGWAMRQKRELWLFQFIAGAFGCYFLGTLFWTLHYFIANDWPRGFSAADLSDIGFYCFFMTASIRLKAGWTQAERVRAGRWRFAALAAPVVVIAFHAAYVLLAGGLVNNALYCIALCFLFYCTLIGVIAGGVYCRYHITVLAVFALELIIFFVSSFGFDALYYVFTYMQMAAWFLIIPAAKKGAQLSVKEAAV